MVLLAAHIWPPFAKSSCIARSSSSFAGSLRGGVCGIVAISSHVSDKLFFAKYLIKQSRVFVIHSHSLYVSRVLPVTVRIRHKHGSGAPSSDFWSVPGGSGDAPILWVSSRRCSGDDATWGPHSWRSPSSDSRSVTTGAPTSHSRHRAGPSCGPSHDGCRVDDYHSAVDRSSGKRPRVVWFNNRRHERPRRSP